MMWPYLYTASNTPAQECSTMNFEVKIDIDSLGKVMGACLMSIKLQKIRNHIQLTSSTANSALVQSYPFPQLHVA